MCTPCRYLIDILFKSLFTRSIYSDLLTASVMSSVIQRWCDHSTPTLQNVVSDATDRCTIQAASSAPSQSLFFMIHPQHFLEAPGSWFPQFPVSSAACPAHCSRHKLVRHAILATYWILKILVATDCLQLGTALLIQSIIAHCISVLWCTLYLNLNCCFTKAQELTWCFTISASAAMVRSTTLAATPQ